MVNYNCPRCGYYSTIKTQYVRHLNKLKLCNNKISDDDLQKEYIKYNIINKIKINNFETKNQQKLTENQQKSTFLYICKYCEKNFSFNQSLNRHFKTCKEKKKTEEANISMKELVEMLNKQLEEQNKMLLNQKEEFIKELEKNKKVIEKKEIELEKKELEFKLELEKRNKQIDELIKKSGINNSKITQNIQNNIKLLAYKNTDISTISDNDIIKCIKHNNMCIPQLIKMIHLDPQKPENHNIYISNLKNGYIMLYDGKKWNTLNRDDTIINLIDEKQNIIEEKIEDWVTKGKEYPELMKKFKRYLEKKENNEVLNKIKEEIKLMLYNYRNVIENEDN